MQDRPINRCDRRSLSVKQKFRLLSSSISPHFYSHKNRVQYQPVCESTNLLHNFPHVSNPEKSPLSHGTVSTPSFPGSKFSKLSGQLTRNSFFKNLQYITFAFLDPVSIHMYVQSSLQFLLTHINLSLFASIRGSDQFALRSRSYTRAIP